MKTEEIVTRLRNKAERVRAPGREVRDMVEWVAADALEAQAREIEDLSRVIEQQSVRHAEFRQRLRSALYPIWPNNMGVGDDEIVSAVVRAAAIPRDGETT